MNFIEELKWRGMIHDIMPGTEEQLANLYFEHHPEVDAVTTLCLLSWAKTHFKSDLMKVYEAELVY